MHSATKPAPAPDDRENSTIPPPPASKRRAREKAHGGSRAALRARIAELEAECSRALATARERDELSEGLEAERKAIGVAVDAMTDLAEDIIVLEYALLSPMLNDSGDVTPAAQSLMRLRKRLENIFADLDNAKGA